MGNQGGGFEGGLREKFFPVLIGGMAILGFLVGVVAGALVSIVWNLFVGGLFFQDAATIGDLPTGWRAVAWLAQIALMIVGAVRGARIGRRLVNRRRVGE